MGRKESDIAVRVADGIGALMVEKALVKRKMYNEQWTWYKAGDRRRKARHRHTHTCIRISCKL